MPIEKTILIMRHAKSSWDDSSLKDFDRPLNTRGRKDAPRMGRYLLSLGLVPDLIVSSSALRAKRTVELLSDAAGIDSGQIRWDRSLYDNGADAYIDAVRRSPQDVETVMVAGHNPTVEEVIARLSSGTIDRRVTTANIACFKSSAEQWGDISEKNAIFKWLIGPKEIDL
jgi:phosphohistidine phosphatase